MFKNFRNSFLPKEKLEILLSKIEYETHMHERGIHFFLRRSFNYVFLNVLLMLNTVLYMLQIVSTTLTCFEHPIFNFNYVSHWRVCCSKKRSNYKNIVIDITFFPHEFMRRIRTRTWQKIRPADVVMIYVIPASKKYLVFVLTANPAL